MPASTRLPDVSALFRGYPRQAIGFELTKRMPDIPGGPEHCSPPGTGRATAVSGSNRDTVRGVRCCAPPGQPVRGIQEVHQPFAFTALPGKIWHGRQSPLSA
jgi:hypothetical protein